MLNYKLTAYSKLCIFIYILINLNNFSLIESIEPCPNTEIKEKCIIKVDVKPEFLNEKFLLFELDNLELLKDDTLTSEKDTKNVNLYHFKSGYVLLENSYPKDKTTEISFLFTPAKSGTYNLVNKIKVISPTKVVLDDLNKLNFFVSFKPESVLNFQKSTDDFVLFSTLQKGLKLNDQDLSNKDVLLESNDFSLSFKDSTEDVIVIQTLIGNKECSKSLQIDKETPLKTIENIYLLKEFNCIYVIESKDKKSKLQLDVLDFKSKNDFIFLQVKNGPKISSEDLISTSLNNYQQIKSLTNTISSQPIVLVIMKSTFISSTYQPSTINIKISNVQKFESSTKFSCAASNGEAICMYTAPENEMAYLKLTKSLLVKEATVSFYNGLEMKEPFLELTNDQFVNNLVYSDTQNLVIKIQTQKSFQIDGEFLSAKNSCNKVANSPSAYILKDSADEQECTFYIAPKSDKDSSFVLNLENYVIRPDSCLSLRIVSQETDYMNLCFDKSEKDLTSKQPLQFVFPSSDHLVLKYKKGKVFKDNKIIVQASFVYDTLALNSVKKLTVDEVNTIYTNNYPLNYPYFLKDYSYKFNTEKDTCIYGSFKSYHFREKDAIVSSKTLTFTKNKPDDFLVKNDYSLTIKSTFDLKEVDKNYEGFKANFEQVKCLEDVKDFIQTPSYPQDFKEKTKCVWVINKFNDKKGKYLDLNIETQKSSLDLGKLKIYDDATSNRDELISYIDEAKLKESKLFNLKTSSSKLVIVYETDKKDVAGFKISFTEKDCSETCDDGTRCILPSIRCNFKQECLDGKDENNCSQGPLPPPAPTPAPQVKSGISGWLVVFFIIPLSMIIGALILKHGPKALAKFKGHTYQEFNTFGEDA